MSKRAIGFMTSAAMAMILSAQVSPKAVRTADEIEPLLKKLSGYEFGQSREPQAQFTQFVQDSLASPALLKQIEAGLITLLQSNATPAAKQFALRELALIGTEASIPVLAPLLLEPRTSEMARFALAQIPGPNVDQALRDALAKSTGSIRIGIVASLGQRRDTKAVPPLAALTSSDDGPTAEAALAALAEIGDAASLKALGASHAKTTGPIARRASEAYLQCADQVAARGDRQSALRVYRELAAAKEPPLVRVGALTGLAGLSPKEAIPLLAPELESKDLHIQLPAIRLLSAIPGSEVTAILHRAFPNLMPQAKVRLLGALTDRGDKSSLQIFEGASKDATPAVRAAALMGLGSLAAVSSIPFIAESAASGQPVEQAAARQVLKTMKGAAVDTAVISAIGSSKGKVKAELILAVGERGTSTAADTVVKAIQDEDPDVHREALRAAKNLAGSNEVPALVNLITNASKPADRKDAGLALASALQRSEPGRIGFVIAAYKSATAVEGRVSLLEALGRISSPDSLALLRGSLADPSPEIVRGSILALSEWADPTPLPDLLNVAKSHSNPASQVLALRGYLKLVGVPSERPYAESARLLADVAPLAKDTADKQRLLALLPSYPCKESIALAESMMKDESVANEAKVALERLKSGAGAPRNRGPQR